MALEPRVAQFVVRFRPGFDGPENGTFVYTLNGVSQTKALTLFVFRAPGTVCQ